MDHRIEFVSQRYRKDVAAFSCGVASLMMLLRSRLRGRSDAVPSFPQLAQMAWLTIEPRFKPYSHGGGFGAYFEDIVRALEGMGIGFEDLSRDNFDGANEIQRRFRMVLSSKPVMAGVKSCRFLWWEGDGHWIVLTGLAHGTLSYLDPWDRPSQATNRQLCWTDFLDEWDGAAIALSSPTGPIRRA